jgi:hypothetical protein
MKPYEYSKNDLPIELLKEDILKAIALVKSNKTNRIDINGSIKIYRAGNIVRMDIRD